MRWRWPWGASGAGTGGPVLAGLAAVALVALLQLAAPPLLERAGAQLFDTFQRAAPRAYAEAPVRVVDVDEESLARLGQWPWPRTELARLDRLLGQAGASVIAYDMVFAEPDRTSPARLAATLARSPEGAALAGRLAGLPDHDAVFAESFAAAPVVSGFFLIGADRGRPVEPKAGIALMGSLPEREVPGYAGAVQSLPVIEAAAAGVGSLTLPPEVDGVVRKIPLLALQGETLVPALSLEALRLHLDQGPIVVRASDGSGETAQAPGAVAGVRVGPREIPVTDAGELWLHYTAPAPERTVAAWRVLDGAMSPAELAEAFGGRIVFVGASATGLRDLVATPLARSFPGVEVHAQAAEQMLLGHYLVRPDWARGLEFALVVLLGGGLALALPRLGAAAGAVLGAIGILAVAGASWLAFAQWRYLLDPTYPALAIVLVYVLQTLLGFYREERRRAYIHNAFDRYLSPEIVKQIAADPGKLDLGGEERDMTVLMCDIRGFSRISEGRNPKQVIEFLIAFLTPMSDILLAHKATLDKFIGDAILAFWNAPLDDPEHHCNGARAALAMVDELAELNAAMPGPAWPGEVKIGIGLNSGPCCVGNMGSRQRLSYSLIGDTVNMAARLEGQTKYYGVRIIAGSALADHLAGFALLELDRVRVVGRDAPETIFALLGDVAQGASEAHSRLVRAHAAMLTAYRAQRWDSAEEALDAGSALYGEAGLETLVALYRERIAALRADPPGESWDGVFQATSK